MMIRTLPTLCLLPAVLMGFLEGAAAGQQTPAAANGQTSYPWRAQSSQGGSATIGDQSARPGVPQPPTMSGAGPAIRLLQAGARMQDTPQDPARAAGGGDDVPNPPQNIPTPGTEQRPGLNVRSNATDPDDAGVLRGTPGDWCCLGEVQRIIGTTPGGLTVGGFSQNGWHNRDTITFNNRRRKFNSHQNWLYVDRGANWAAGRQFGFRFDGLYGIDAQDIQAIGNSPTGAPTGWDNSWDNGSYGWALPQAFVEWANCDTNVRVGKFLSPIGFEQVPSSENFFYSRTYARYYTEPFSHTGLLAQRQVGDGLMVMGGASAGWNTGFDRTDNGFNLLTGGRMRVNDRVNLGLAGSIGDTGYRGSGILQTATAEVRLAQKVVWAVQGDFLNLQSNDELGLTNYLFYCHNRCLSLGTRLEWWKSDQLFTSSRSTWSLTTGINWRPHANVVIRPEFRTDWGAAALTPGDPIVAIDAIVLF